MARVKPGHDRFLRGANTYRYKSLTFSVERLFLLLSSDFSFTKSETIAIHIPIDGIYSRSALSRSRAGRGRRCLKTCLTTTRGASRRDSSILLFSSPVTL
jgi:hypothetical protein